MHKADFVSRLVYDHDLKKFKCIVKAVWRSKDADVYIQDEDGNCQSRCLYDTSYGRFVLFPNETNKPGTYSYYYGTFIEDGTWYKSTKLNFYGISKNISYDVEKLILESEYKFLYEKYKQIQTHDFNNLMFINLLEVYKNADNRKRSEIEWLIEKNQFNLIFTPSTFNCSKEIKNKIINFIKDKNNNADVTQFKYNNILYCLKHKIPYEDINIIKKYGSLENYLYCQKQNIHYVVYRDHLQMLKNKALGINKNDPYWYHPSNFHERHQELIKKVNAIKDIEKENMKLKFNESSRKLAKRISEKIIDGYRFYIPVDYEDFKKHAEDLNQCLISSRYYEKVINKKLILIFIKKDEKSIATCSINYDKQIDQFYANEKDRTNCKPTKKVKDGLNKFLKTFELKKRKKIA